MPVAVDPTHVGRKFKRFKFQNHYYRVCEVAHADSDSEFQFYVLQDDKTHIGFLKLRLDQSMLPEVQAFAVSIAAVGDPPDPLKVDLFTKATVAAFKHSHEEIADFLCER